MKKPLSKWWSKIRKSAYGHINKAEQERAYIRYHWSGISYIVPAEWKYFNSREKFPDQYKPNDQTQSWKIPGEKGYLIEKYRAEFQYDEDITMHVAIHVTEYPGVLASLGEKQTKHKLDLFIEQPYKSFRPDTTYTRHFELQKGVRGKQIIVTWDGNDEYHDWPESRCYIIASDVVCELSIIQRRVQQFTDEILAEFQEIIESVEVPAKLQRKWEEIEKPNVDYTMPPSKTEYSQSKAQGTNVTTHTERGFTYCVPTDWTQIINSTSDPIMHVYTSNNGSKLNIYIERKKGIVSHHIREDVDSRYTIEQQYMTGKLYPSSDGDILLMQYDSMDSELPPLKVLSSKYTDLTGGFYLRRSNFTAVPENGRMVEGIQCVYYSKEAYCIFILTQEGKVDNKTEKEFNDIIKSLKYS